MKKIKLEFEKEGKGISKSLSAFVRLEDSIFAAGDEGGDLARLKEFDDGTCFKLKELINLSDWFDLPISPQKELTKQLVEVDLEGMDFDYTNQLLWMVGSHSLKRGKANAMFDTKKNLELLGKVKPDTNRFFLGCLFLHKNKNNQFRLSPSADDNNTRAAQLRCDATTSELLDEIRHDTLFTRFCDKNGGIPGKDNGIDIEGLACAPNGRVLVGMRGPVLRGIATVLELAPERIDSPNTKADQLQLTKIGPTGLKYRRHFMDLAGHGIRDLCWDGDDLLVLVGPTTGLDSPPLIFRWKAAIKAFGKMRGDEEKFIWRSGNVLVQQSLGSTWKQVEAGADHAEAITLFDKKRLMIDYDSPSTKRFHKPASVIVDIVDL
ncbi:hypothetical protein Nit79A3_1780 [Nitrosomonas sp. Is79A3]|uniref:DUF3616 domain-containing protein n=1 Tax=Nitrosomonas sp. (strain Is79A3) TaxID=261292 RepID=UPI000215CA04